MPTWLRRSSGILTLGGGAIGIAAIAMQAVAGPLNAGLVVFGGLFLGVYLYGIVAGAFMLERDRRGLTWSLRYWLIQIPLITSVWFTYRFSSGAHLYVVYGDSGLDFVVAIGSYFDIRVLSDNSFSMGINVLAIVFAVLLGRHGREVE